MKPVVVIGGGMTGLSAAQYLHKMNIRPILLESAPRCGGVIESVVEDGFLAESGPCSLMVATPRVRELIRDAGLEVGERIEASAAGGRRYIVKDARLVALPSKPGEIFSSPIFSGRAKARALAEPFIRRGEGDESVAEFARRRFGEEPFRYLVDPFISGIYAGDAERLSMRHAFPAVFEMERAHGSVVRGMMKRGSTGEPVERKIVSFRSGMKALPDHLAAHLGEDCLRSCRVTVVEPAKEGWLVRAARDGSAIEIAASGVIACVPSHELPSLPLRVRRPELLATLAEIPYAPVRTVTLGFRRGDVNHPLDGFGYLVPSSERLRHLGTLFTSSLFPGRAPDGSVTLASFVGGAKQPDLGRADLETVLPMLLEGLRALLGVRGEPVHVKSFRHERAIPQLELGHDRFLDAAKELEESNRGIVLAGTWRDGISLPNAIDAGWAAARRMSEEIYGR